MKNVSRFLFSYLLPLFLLLGGSAALAADTDGDGIPDVFSVKISTGGYHACAIATTGVRCWGDNFYGQTTVPVLVNPVAISAGYLHTCAIDDNGVHCWGYNGFYGDGRITAPALSNPVAVSAGYDHTCAIDDTGVHCWGDNSRGQTTVPTLSNPIAISAGQGYTCAIDATGVHCWGDNRYNQATAPVLINPTIVSAGETHTCALDASGVHCWGYNEENQSTVPAFINSVAVSVGAAGNTCVLDANGVHCWGNDYYGQSTVPPLINPIAISASYSNTCALDVNGVHCWGYDYYGISNTPALAQGDNCSSVINPDQLDTDNDFIGDVCDTDIDGDGMANASDVFPLDATETEDEDGDNLGDNSDPIIGDANTLNNFLNDMKVDKAGASVAFAGDFNGDGYGDYVIGIPGYDVPATVDTKIQKDAGRAVVVSGKSGDELASVNGDAAKDAMGFAVAGGGDIDNDGFDDVIVGAPKADSYMIDDGSVTVLYGPDGSRTNMLMVYYPQAKALSGSAVALGDVDNDGYADIIIGAPRADDLRDPEHKVIDAGVVEVWSGKDFIPMPDMYGATAKAYFGTSIATGDIDNDGKADIIIGAPNDEDESGNLKDTGSVTVYKINGDELLKKYGAVAKAFLGKSVASGDFNNDGFADVLAGAPGDDNETLKDTGSITIFYGNNALPPATKYLTTAKAGLGVSVAAGDIDGDGYDEVFGGAAKNDAPTIPKITKDAGSVTVWSVVDNVVIDTKYGEVSKDYFGSSVSAGDVNGDGKADVIIGIPGFDVSPMPPAKIIKDAGAVKVISGATF